jgi:predicted CopG family antitoxin
MDYYSIEITGMGWRMQVGLARVPYVWHFMNRKLTITVSEDVYEGLHRKIGKRRISQFIERLARPHVVPADIEQSYREMAADDAREEEALEWSEGLIGDSLPGSHASR